MGLSGLSVGHLLVVLVVVALVFGTKRLGSIGADLGEAIKGFRKAMASEDEPRPASHSASAVAAEPSTALHSAEAGPAQAGSGAAVTSPAQSPSHPRS